MKFLQYRALPAVLAVLAFFSACKKEDLKADLNPDTSGTGTAADALKDTALSYTRDIYLWYNQIPATFDARSYSGLDKIMTAIRQYSNEPGFSAPVDRWSFAMKKTEWNNLSSGVSGDFGLDVFFRTEGDLRVKSVERSSPAGLAGVRRGWKITKINGNNSITTTNADFIVQAVWNSSSSSFSFQKPDGSTVDITLNAGTYQDHPVILDSVYTVNAKKVGYFSFNSFLGDTMEIYNEFARVFNRFASQQVSELVVDLRYNGGGYVSVQQKLANWLAPATANGQLMMQQQFNDKYTRFNTSDLFHKLGSLNLSRIFFIVSSSTASASELLINNLKPYLDVQLIGPGKTYGKPVGFFPIEVGDQFIFPVSFRLVNKNGEGNYFNGLALNGQVADGLDKDWGDVGESCLQSALSYISGGVFRMSQAAQEVLNSQESPQLRSGNQTLDRPRFKGAVDQRIQ